MSSNSFGLVATWIDGRMMPLSLAFYTVSGTRYTRLKDRYDALMTYHFFPAPRVNGPLRI
jgi:hypothetical protein